MVRRLVINADDLGLTIGVNEGIFDAHGRGVLTSASLFANAPATADAISRIRQCPSLGVGCHLTLVDGRPTLSPRHVPTLVEDDGRFRPSWKPFIVACLTGRVSLDEVERELTAQIDKIRSEGVRLTHLDAHKHVHAFPPIFAIVARLANRFAIPVVRVPFERWSPPQRRCAPTSHGAAAVAAERRDAALGATRLSNRRRPRIANPEVHRTCPHRAAERDDSRGGVTRTAGRDHGTDGPPRLR